MPVDPSLARGLVESIAHRGGATPALGKFAAERTAERVALIHKMAENVHNMGDATRPRADYMNIGGRDGSYIRWGQVAGVIDPATVTVSALVEQAPADELGSEIQRTLAQVAKPWEGLRTYSQHAYPFAGNTPEGNRAAGPQYILVKSAWDHIFNITGGAQANDGAAKSWGQSIANFWHKLTK